MSVSKRIYLLIVRMNTSVWFFLVLFFVIFLLIYLHFSIKHSRLPHPVPTPTGHLLHQGMLGSLKQTDWVDISPRQCVSKYIPTCQKGLKYGFWRSFLLSARKKLYSKVKMCCCTFCSSVCSWVISGLLVYAVHCRVFALCWCETNAVLLSSTHCAVTLALVGCG